MKSFMNSFKEPLNIFLAIFCLVLVVSVLEIYKEGFTSSSSEVLGYGTNYNVDAKNININGNEIINIIFTADNGNSAQIIYKNNNYILIVINEYGTSIEYIYTPTTKSNTDTLPIIYNNAIFVGTNGGSAKLIKLSNGNYIIQLSMPNGKKIIFVSKMNDQINDNNQIYSNKNYMYYSNQPYQTYNEPIQNYNEPSQNYNEPYQTYNQNYNYSNDLPEGIPASKIPLGQEDLYILKSEIVPPVCPAPVPAVQSSTEQCAPCPPCARCPQPNFECKKVPNYSSSNNDLPSASMSPYSTFGS